jgi:serine protease Do
VLTIANPFAAGFRDGSPSASWGIVSNVRRRPASQTVHEFERARLLHDYGTLLQTDARLNLGCSGGALINLRGEAIGLTTALVALPGSEAAGGYAIPFDERMRRIVQVLKEGREVEYGFLGVQLSPDAGRGEGVRVFRVTPGSPAARAGLLGGDVIVAVDDMPVYENDDLFFTVGTALAGSEIQVEYRRPPPRGMRKEVRVTLAKFYVPTKVIASKRVSIRGLRVDYTSLLLQQPTMLRGIPDGVVISDVEPSSPAANAGLKVNEIITRVNGREVNSPADFYQQGKQPGPLEVTLAQTDPMKPAPKVVID